MYNIDTCIKRFLFVIFILINTQHGEAKRIISLSVRKSNLASKLLFFTMKEKKPQIHLHTPTVSELLLNVICDV